MEIKYGYIKTTQIQIYKERLHKSIHRCLRFKEEDYPNLNRYFNIILFQLGGLNELLNFPGEIIELMSLLEAARLEALKENCNWSLYRKAILDSHSLIDHISEVD